MFRGLGCRGLGLFRVQVICFEAGGRRGSCFVEGGWTQVRLNVLDSFIRFETVSIKFIF